jgi:hypothetical protein
LNEFGCSGEQPSSFILHDRKFEQIRQRRSAAGGSCFCTTEDFLNEFGCSGEQPSSFILHDQNFEQIRRQKRKFFWRFTHYAHILSVPFMA